MKLTPRCVVSTTTSAAYHDNAKRTSEAEVQYVMRGSIIKGRPYKLSPRQQIAAFITESLHIGERRQGTITVN